jgi:transposase
VPDHSAFSRARNDGFRESNILRELSERIVSDCIKARQVGGEGVAVDASLIEADANRRCSIRQ